MNDAFPNGFLGLHLLAEFTGCDCRLFDDVRGMERVMRQAAAEAQTRVVESCFHHFSPYGVSGVVVIAESHLTIHTWPEHAYAAVDVFTCGDTANPRAALDFLKGVFCAQGVEVSELQRGPLPLIQRSQKSSVLSGTGKDGS